MTSLWAWGCGSVSQKRDAGVTPDTGADTSPSTTDAGNDTGSTDARVDVGSDVVSDAGLDANVPATDATDAADARAGDAGAADASGVDGGAGDGGGTLNAVWTTNAQALRTQSGAYFTFNCPSNGAPAGIWGTDAYTDDSSICTAAVHVGLITMTAGGSVTIEIIPGLTAYSGSVRNGITSQMFGPWTASFRFPAATIWTTAATLYRGQNTLLLRYVCPAGGSVAAAIYGTDIYSDDSPVCVAAVHAGLITAASGGSIQIELEPGQSSYAASARHGVTSLAYGVWPGSYIFPP